MKYCITNPLLDQQIKEIRTKIRLSMNGVVSDQMVEMGIHYKKNYGVSIPRIKEIARLYTPNHDLAQRLWLLEQRETMILATLLEPIEVFTLEMANQWVKQINQTELMEQCTMNLFAKLPYAYQLSAKWIDSDTPWIKTTGFVLAARVAQKLDNEQIKTTITAALEDAMTSNFHLYKAIALCLSRICRKDENTAQEILTSIRAIPTERSASISYILNELTTETNSLGYSI